MKPQTRVDIFSYGIYRRWDPDARELPELKQATTTVPAVPGTEFGFILEFYGARGDWIEFVIDHPPFTDDNGNVLPPFTGHERVRTNEYRFFLGDAVWEPVVDKLGAWRLSCSLQGEEVAVKTFTVVPAEELT